MNQGSDLPIEDRHRRLEEAQKVDRRLLTHGLAHLQKRFFELEERLSRLEEEREELHG